MYQDYCSCPLCTGSIGDYYPFATPEEYALWDYEEATDETREPDEDWYDDIFDNPYEADDLKRQEMIDGYGWSLYYHWEIR